MNYLMCSSEGKGKGK